MNRSPFHVEAKGLRDLFCVRSLLAYGLQLMAFERALLVRGWSLSASPARIGMTTNEMKTCMLIVGLSADLLILIMKSSFRFSRQTC
jgi:hypothetical protein